MNVFKSLAKAFYTSLENSQKARVMNYFQDMSDKQLADIGISRALLQQGVKAYPWHVADENAESAKVVSFPKKSADITVVANPRLAA